MKSKFDTSTHAVGVLTGARTTEGRSRPSVQRRPGVAGVIRASRTAELILVAATCAGCVASNYDFDALSEVRGHSRGARLSEDLVLEKEDGGHEDLFDLDMIPLARTHLNVFSEADDEGIPDGFVEADFDAYLPLFGFVDATVNRYDSDRRLYERHEFNSYLWGLFQTHREEVDTKVGLREKKMRRFLWVFSWRSSPRYSDSTSEASLQ